MNWQPTMDIQTVRLMMLLVKLRIRLNKFAEGDAFMDTSTNSMYVIHDGQIVRVTSSNSL